MKKIFFFLAVLIFTGCSPRVNFRELNPELLGLQPVETKYVTVLKSAPHDKLFRRVAIAYVTLPGYLDNDVREPLLKELADRGCTYVLFFGDGYSNISGIGGNPFAYDGINYASAAVTAEKNIYAYGYIRESDD